MARCPQRKKKFFVTLMDDLGLPVEARREIVAFASHGQPDMSDIEVLRRAGAKDRLLGLLRRAAAADGVIRPEEVVYITQVEAALLRRLGAPDYPLSREHVSDEPIKERFDVEGELSRGSFGVVLKAKDRTTGAPLVIKLFHVEDELRGDEQSMQALEDRFWREVALTEKIRSPYAVRVLTAGFDVSTPYVVLSYIEGVTLEALIAANGPLSPARTYRLMSHVLHAVADGHRQGIVHRDLKPENIVVTGEGLEERATVLDFGVAGVIAELKSTHNLMAITLEDEILGTASFMAPEQMHAFCIARPQSDVYAMGLIMAECLSGQRVYASDDPFTTMARHFAPEPVPLAPLVEASGFGEIVRRACQKKWTQRYEEAGAMLEALHLCSEATLSQHTKSPGRGTAFLKRLLKALRRSDRAR